MWLTTEDDPEGKHCIGNACRISPNNSIQVQSNPMENHSTGMLMKVMEIPRAKMTLMVRKHEENYFIYLGSQNIFYLKIKTQFWEMRCPMLALKPYEQFLCLIITSIYMKLNGRLLRHCRMNDCCINPPTQ